MVCAGAEELSGICGPVEAVGELEPVVITVDLRKSRMLLCTNRGAGAAAGRRDVMVVAEEGAAAVVPVLFFGAARASSSAP